MRIKLESDIHINFSPKYEPSLFGVDLYILAGDVGEKLQGYEFCKKLLDSNPNLVIIYVAGNHEFYSRDRIEKVLRLLKEKSDETDRFYFLNNSSTVINGIKFIGATLWTDFNKMNPYDIGVIKDGLNDYNYITTEKLNYQRITPFFINRLHQESKRFIFNELENSKEKCIVVTHHQPYLSENNSRLKYGFEVDLTDEFNNATKLPIYWFHGHTHTSFKTTEEFTNGEVCFISNQLGYPEPYESAFTTGYKHDFILEI